MPQTAKDKNSAVIIKKYPNRRLYDTSTSRYVNLEELRDLIKSDVDFQVVDAKTGDDLTRSVLTQIIFEQESKGLHLLPNTFLRQLIRFYDDNLGRVLAEYMAQAMENFTQNHEQMKDLMEGSKDYSPFKQFEEMGQRNMEIFDKTMSMFTPFGFKDEDKKD